jgi:hypothetical protein
MTVTAAVCAVIFLIFWLRRPESLLHASFWAEDGAFFFHGQMALGFWRTLIEPYNGYLNTDNRLIVEALSPLPFRWLPAAYSFCSIVIQSVSCAAFSLPNFRWIVKSDALRAACCIIAAAAIPTSVELIGTVCNLHWYLSVLSLLLLVVGGRETTRKAVEIFCTVVQLVIALSAPTTLLFLPFLVWQVKTKQAWLKLRPALHAAALCLQVWIMVRFPMPGAKPKFHFNTLFLATLTSGISRCVLAPAIGARYLLHDSDVALFTKMVIALMACVAVLTWVVLRLRRSPRLWFPLSALYVGAGSVLMAMGGRNFAQTFLTVDGIAHFSATRYFLVGSCMFIFCAAFALDTFTARKDPALAVVLLAALFALGAVRNFALPPVGDFDWKDSAARLEKWDAARKRHEKVAAISLPINPPGWAVTFDSEP